MTPHRMIDAFSSPEARFIFAVDSTSRPLTTIEPQLGLRTKSLSNPAVPHPRPPCANLDFGAKRLKHFNSDKSSALFALSIQILSCHGWTPPVVDLRRTKLSSNSRMNGS